MTDRRGDDADSNLPPSKFGAGYTVGGHDLAPNTAPPPIGGAPNMGYSAAAQSLPPVNAYYVQPAPNPQVPGYPTVTPPQSWSARPGTTNPLAIAALVSSFFLPPLGILLGHIALANISQTGEEGRDMAVAGLVIGYLVTGLFFVLMIAIFA